MVDRGSLSNTAIFSFQPRGNAVQLGKWLPGGTISVGMERNKKSKNEVYANM